jgi:hypothetical protein
VFLGFSSPNRRESPPPDVGLFAIRVNVPALCLVSLRTLRALRLLRDFGEQFRPRSYFGRTLKPTIIQDLRTQGSRFFGLEGNDGCKPMLSRRVALSAIAGTARNGALAL